MFARNVSIRLKPNTLKDFNQTLEAQIVPILRKQAGFRDEIAIASDDSLHVTAISLWDTKEQAETYNATAYPEVSKTLDKYLDGPMKVRLSSVVSSTSHKVTSVIATA